MDIDFQPIQAQQASVPSSSIDFQPMKDSSTLDKVASSTLAATSGATQGVLKGIGQTLEAGPNIVSSLVEHGLNLLNDVGIVPDSVAKGFSNARSKAKTTIEGIGNKILDFQGQPGAVDRAKNPTTAAVGDLVGNVAGASVAAGGLVGKLGSSLSPVMAGAVNQGAQGVLMGAGATSDSPLQGGSIGGVLGSVGGAVAGRFGRQAEVINDKIDDAQRIGVSPYSEAGIKSIKGALDNGGKELTEEEVQKVTKQAIQDRLSAAVPKVDLVKDPATMITDMAKENFPKVKATKNALYQPLNESKAIADTTNLSSTIDNTTDKIAKKLLPPALPENPSISDLMTYRKQVSAGIDQVDRTLAKGSINASFNTLEQLQNIKKAVTTDLNESASKVGLGDQLAKADAFHKNNYLPFKVFNKSGQLSSEADTNQAWGKVAQLLKSKRPNLDAMTNVASTLGPQGKEVFGSAYLQQAVNRSMTVDGRIIPTKITAELNKLANSGLAQHILTPEIHEAFEGMRSIAEGALKTTKGMSGDAKGAVMDFISGLTHSTPGITLLRGLGSKTSSSAKVKNVVAKLLLNAAELKAPTTLNNDSQ